jgi:phosphatidylserine/phosphatidylglycerophosphate/cardiolipin synthase-like enzyme
MFWIEFGVNRLSKPRIHFTDPHVENKFKHLDEDIQEALQSLFRKANESITIYGFTLRAFSKRNKGIFSRDIISRQKNNIHIVVFGEGTENFQVEFPANRITRYEWVTKENGRPGIDPKMKGDGNFHIKAVVIDKRYVYIGSANFSHTAFNWSAEWGITIESCEMANELERYGKYLIDEKMVEKKI